MSVAVRVWEDNFKILNKIRSKSERNALCFALIYYGFCGKVPQDLKLNENNLLLFEVLKNNFIAKNQGGAPVGNFNRCLTVEKNKSTDIQPLSENRKEKTEIIPPDNNKLLSSPKGEQKTKKFTKPTVEEINTYCRERQNTISAEQFFNFYESKGWRIGSSPMKDWKAAVRTWEAKERTINAAKGLVKSNDDFWRQLGC